MATICELCCEEKENFKCCTQCKNSVCGECYKKISECAYCKNEDFGMYDPQKKAVELSEYFKEENLQEGLRAALALHNELNNDSEEEEGGYSSDEEEHAFIDFETQIQIALALSVG